MHLDPEAESGLPVPDHVPDDLTSKYGRSARRSVRLSRSRGYPVVRRVRRAGRLLRDADVWLFALTVFAWSIVAVGAMGALVYAVMLLPGAVPFLLLPTAALLAVSVGIAAMVSRRRAGEPEPAPF
jgi:uncharacterized membrane protein YbhN (UPF0104 family)